MRVRKLHTNFFVFLLLATIPLRTEAAELLYFYSDACEYCEQWDEEVGILYNKTEESAILKLRPVDIHEQIPKDIEYVKGVIYTPTFVAIDNGREVGRIVGYAGDLFFWQHMEIMLKDMKKSKATPVSSCSDEARPQNGPPC